MEADDRPCRKVEGRAIVRIGSRDPIVRIEVLKASVASIVSIATAIRDTEPRRSSHLETTTEKNSSLIRCKSTL